MGCTRVCALDELTITIVNEVAGRVAELADAKDLKSFGCKTVRVQIPPRPPLFDEVGWGIFRCNPVGARHAVPLRWIKRLLAEFVDKIRRGAPVRAPV